MDKNLLAMFPELSDPKWIAKREESWQLALEKGDWKKEYRKKDLEKIRHYFFTGEVPSEYPLSQYTETMLLMFPIQTKEGYDWYYQNHEFSEENMKSLVGSAFMSQECNGMSSDDEVAYFDYHVGEQFSTEREFSVCGHKVVVGINPVERFLQLTGTLCGYLKRPNLDRPTIIRKMLAYYESLVDWNEESELIRYEDHMELLKTSIARLQEKLRNNPTGDAIIAETQEIVAERLEALFRQVGIYNP